MTKKKKVKIENKLVSEDRKKYLKKIKTNKIKIFITQITIAVAFIVIWEVLARLNIIDSFIMSSPSRIWQTFMNLGSNDILKHLWVTVYETIAGFLIGTVLGIIIAIILWWSKFLSKVAEPFLVVLNSLPKVALRTSNNYMGRLWNRSNNNNGSSNFFNSNNIRKLKWIYENRYRFNKNG